jgi:hypothetical protein
LYEIRKDDFAALLSYVVDTCIWKATKNCEIFIGILNANGMHHVLEGRLKVGIYSYDGVFNEYVVETGDIWFRS